MAKQFKPLGGVKKSAAKNKLDEYFASPDSPFKPKYTVEPIHRIPKIEVWQQQDSKEWWWKITASNGRQIGGSTEGYHNREDCINNMKSVGQALTDYKPPFADLEKAVKG